MLQMTKGIINEKINNILFFSSLILFFIKISSLVKTNELKYDFTNISVSLLSRG